MSYADSNDDPFITVADVTSSPATSAQLQYSIRPQLKAHQLSFQGEQQPAKKVKIGGGSGSGGSLIARFFGGGNAGRLQQQQQQQVQVQV